MTGSEGVLSPKRRKRRIRANQHDAAERFVSDWHWNALDANSAKSQVLIRRGKYVVRIHAAGLDGDLIGRIEATIKVWEAEQ